ncbi:hypothetical protein ACLKA6_002337 [Drosophila palustris]
MMWRRGGGKHHHLYGTRKPMAEAISSAANSMELALKDTNVGVGVGVGGLIVDMTPKRHLHLHLSASESEQPEARRSLATTPTPTPTATNLSTTSSNLSPHSPPPMTFRCERCDNFETSSRATLLLHVVQCLAGQAAVAAAAAAAVRLKSEPEHEEPENMSVSHMDTTGHNHSHNNQKSAESSSSASSSPAGGGSGGGGGGGASASSRKVFECDVCNMKFSNGANMRRHKMRHTGVKPYECRVCQKRFFRKDHLAEHFTTHTKTLPYHCPICNRGFQRQIAMRAHFQNEHVGQHDLVKTCPLCSYRAGSMKSLRIHFFNRHGIDLDNPGPGGTSSLLLALESQASAAAAAAAAAANYVSPSMATTIPQQQQQQQQQQQAPPPPPSAPASHQSDSGESMRSLENATPPMHFLTPHVEISTLNENGNTELFNGNNHSNNNSNNNNNTSNNNNNNNNSELDSKSNDKLKEHAILLQTPVVLGAPQDLPMDCNTKATPISSSTTTKSLHHHNHHHHHQPHHHHHHHHENHITPSISLIPIKQEPLLDDADRKEAINSNAAGDANSDTEIASNNNNNNNNNNSNNKNNRITSLIKVSPLKSLLREDLKRRICAKANNRITRNATPLEHELQNMPQNLMNGSAGSVATVAAGGPGGNANATTTPNGNHNNGNSSTPICNGTITSTGQESDLLLNRKQILTCHFCGIEFPDETLYFLHKGCHCESNPWKCNICGEQLNNVYEFNSHLLSKSHQ